MHREAAGDQSCEESRGARDGNDLNFVFEGGADESIGGIGNSWSAGVGDQGHFLAFFEQFDDFVDFVVAGVGVIAEEGFVDFVFVEEDFGMASIFCGDVVHFFESVEGA